MIGGLVLAAGAGARFGEAAPKQLADLGGRPLLQWAVEAACAVPALERVVVVLGSRAPEVRAAVPFGRAEPVVCADWSTGQSASLRCGVEALAGAEAIVVTLGDAPLVTPQVIAMILDQRPPARAVYDGRPGHPVLLGAAQLRALGAVEGDVGARGLLRAARRIEAGHLCSGRDVDTPDDLEEVRSEARAVI